MTEQTTICPDCGHEFVYEDDREECPSEEAVLSEALYEAIWHCRNGRLGEALIHLARVVPDLDNLSRLTR